MKGNEYERHFQKTSTWDSEMCILFVFPGADGGYNRTYFLPGRHAGGSAWSAEFVQSCFPERQAALGPTCAVPGAGCPAAARNPDSELRVPGVPAPCGDVLRNGPSRCLDDHRPGRLGPWSGSHSATHPSPRPRGCSWTQSLQPSPRGHTAAGPACDPTVPSRGHGTGTWSTESNGSPSAPCPPASFRSWGAPPRSLQPSGSLTRGSGQQIGGQDCGTDPVADKAPPSARLADAASSPGSYEIIRCSS